MRRLFRAGWLLFTALMWRRATRKAETWMRRARWWRDQAERKDP